MTAENSTENNVESISSLHFFLAPLRTILDDEQVTEVCINKPHEAFIQRYVDVNK
jgi:type IV secretion system protein VirB11